MFRITHKTLLWIVTPFALVGQFLLNSSPKLAILLCGVALAAALVDGWRYLQPIGNSWWYPALLGLLGFSMWTTPRGWFFMAWSVIQLGTGIRAQRIIQRFSRAVAEEQARQQRLAALGFGDMEEPGNRPVQESVPAPALPPIPLWRYPLAILVGVGAAWLGAWATRIFFQITGWQIDVLAIGIGYLVGKAITAGAGDRSNRTLRWASAVLSVAGVLYGRYLLLRYLLFERRNVPTQPMAVLKLAASNPAQTLGIWLLFFVAVGAWAGWRYAQVPARSGLSRRRAAEDRTESE